MSHPTTNLKKAAGILASAGRGGDTVLAHINPQEASLLKSAGGSGTINPDTGLPEFNVVTQIRDTLEAASAPKASLAAPNTNVADITKAYKDYFGKDTPDQEGLDYWTQQANEKGGFANIQSDFLKSGIQVLSQPKTAVVNPNSPPATGILSSVKAPATQTVSPSTYTPTGYAPANVASTDTTATGYTAQAAPDAVGGTATGYDAAQITGQESVSDAVNRIINQDSPVSQTARTQAAQAANSRGLLNSSMAVQSGQQAVINSALPIAQGDVATSLAVNQSNQGAVNAARSFLATAKNVMEQSRVAEVNQNGRFNAEQANSALAFTTQAKNQAEALSVAAKNTAAQLNTAAANQAAAFIAGQTTQAAAAAAAAENAANSQNATAYNAAMAQYADAMNQATMQQVKGAQAIELANIEAQYRTTIQTSDSASKLMTAAANAIAAIQSDVNTTPEQKAAGVTKQQEMLKGSIAVIQGARDPNVDMTTLLNFKPDLTSLIKFSPATTPADTGVTP